MKTWRPGDKDEAGVYLIELDGVIRYIGQTNSMRKRMGSQCVHVTVFDRPPKIFRGQMYMFCKVFLITENDELQRLEIERRLIAEHNPCLNIRSRIVSAPFKKFIEIIGSQAEAAKLLDISPSQVSLMAAGKRTIRPAIAERIEIATRGEVTKESLVFGGSRRVAQD